MKIYWGYIVLELNQIVKGGSDEEFDDLLQSRLSHVYKLHHPNKILDIWKGNSRHDKTKIYAVKHNPSGIAFFASREDIKSLDSFIYGVCLAFDSFAHAMQAFKDFIDEREVH